MNIDYNADVIVIGGGPAGISAALTVARAGKKVVLLERSNYPGSKNMYGGAIYTTALKEVFKEDFDKIPYERIINSHTWAFLTDNSSFELTYKNSSNKMAYATKRFNLEKAMIDIAKSKGVYFCPNTLVKNLVFEENKIVGVKTELEDFYAPITIIADGVNSLLAREAGMRHDFDRHDFILSAKEVYKLDKKIIEERFNLNSDFSNGVNKQYFGSDFGKLKGYKNLFMMSFLYTFKDCIALGVGVNLEDLSKNKLNISDILDEVKQHPDIAPLIQGSEMIEYSAHLIPEGGYKKIPKLYCDGAMIVGDAAGFVNGVHFEGTNFALISGKYAAQAALHALEKEDYSYSTLAIYRKYLEDSFIMKDLYSYRNVIENLYKRSNSLSVYYPNKIKEFFEIITSANCCSKSAQLKKFVNSFVFDRNPAELTKDLFAFSKCALNVFFGK